MNFGNSIEMPNEFDGLSQDADSVLTVIDLHEEREASKPFTVDKGTGIITINNFVPQKHLAFPAGATDVSITGAWAIVNFEGENFDTKLSNTVSMPINNTSGTVTLTPSAVPKGTGTNIFAIQIVFSQTVSGQTYSLNKGSFNCLCIVGVN